MALIYANTRLCKGPFKAPQWIVMGQEEGSPFRRVYRSEGLARRFFSKMQERPRISGLAIVKLPD